TSGAGSRAQGGGARPRPPAPITRRPGGNATRRRPLLAASRITESAPALPLLPTIAKLLFAPLPALCARTLQMRRQFRPLAVCFVMLNLTLVVLAADEPTPKELARSYTGHTEAVYAVAVSPDGNQLLTGSFDKTVKLFDFASGKELKTFGGEKGHQNLVL